MERNVVETKACGNRPINMYNVREIRERIGDMVVKPFSDRGQEVIHDGRSHVTEIWEDGEVTTTKAGDLYGNRRLHGSEPPFLPTANPRLPTLWEVPEDHDHRRMVVVDREALEILAEYRELTIDEELLEHLQETGYTDDS